jgi:DNA-binding transcriptional LysR family regulator
VLRAGTLQDSSMVGRRVALLPQVTVASPAYLAQHGEPESLEALGAHRAINYISSATGKPAPLEFTVDGRTTTVQLDGIVSVTGADLYAGAAVAGLGLVQMPRYRVASELAEPSEGAAAESHHRRCRCRCCTRRTGSFHRACACSRSGCGYFRGHGDA